MTDDPFSRDRENKQYIAQLAERQFANLEAASDLVDRKSGTLLGFLAIIISLALQAGLSPASTYLDKVLVYISFLLLFLAIGFLVKSISPKVKHYDPDPVVLMEKYWKGDFEKTMGTVASNIAQAWQHNYAVHEEKAKWYGLALKPAVAGLFLLTFDVLVIRVFGVG